MESSKINKFHQINNDIIVIDGFWGSGKSLIKGIVENLQNVQSTVIHSPIEQLCIAHKFKEIRRETASVLIKFQLEELYYKNLIGRHINLRWNDITGFKYNLNKFRTLKMLFSKEGDQILEVGLQNNVALSLMTHNLFSISEPLFDSCGTNLKFVEIVRHPLFMVNHCLSYLKRFNVSRDYTLSINHKENKVPWFMEPWADEFSEANLAEKSIMIIDKSYEILNLTLRDLSKHQVNLLIVSFEDLTLNTYLTVSKIEKFLKRERGNRLSEYLKKSNLPRYRTFDGLVHTRYESTDYLNMSEKDVYDFELNRLYSSTSSAQFNKFVERINWYNLTFPSELSTF